jgi:threonine/homoserine/homoserine lactone efflux protein
MLAASILGFVCGFLGSMPVAGPIAVLVFRRGIDGRLRSGVYLACGAAIAESVYAYFAYWGFTELLTHHRWIEPVSRAFAAVVLIGLGVRFIVSPTRKKVDATEETDRKNVGNKRSFLLGFTISAMNPALLATWPAFIALTSALITSLPGLEAVRFAPAHALSFALGVLMGIVMWFGILLVLLARFRDRIGNTTLDKVVRGMGVFLIVLGLYFGVKVIASLMAGAPASV